MSLMTIMISISRLFLCFDSIAPSDIMKIVKTAMLFAQWDAGFFIDPLVPDLGELPISLIYQGDPIAVSDWPFVH